MDVSNNLSVELFAFDKAKEVKNHQVLSALGMTSETEKAQAEIDNSIKEEIAKTLNKGVGLDIKA
jgi:hypothetical protein